MSIAAKEHGIRRKTFGELKRVETLSTFQSYQRAYERSGTIFAAENPVSRAKTGERGRGRELASPFASFKTFFG